MNVLFGTLFSVLFLYGIEAADLLIRANEENKALPLKGIDKHMSSLWTDGAVKGANRGPQIVRFVDVSGNQLRRPIGISEEKGVKGTDSGLVANKQHVKERGWNNWGQSSWSDQSDSNDWSSGNEPSLLPLPQSGKQCCGGKNGWGLPSLPDQSNAETPEILPPPPAAEPEHSWGGNQWLPDQSSNDQESEQEWSNPSQWSSSKGCDCSRQYGGPNPNNPPLPQVNYPSYPSGPNYSPIRPKPNRQSSSWGHWDSMPWNSFEKGGHRGKGLVKGADIGGNVEENKNKAEELTEAQQSTGNGNAVNGSQSGEVVEQKTIQVLSTNISANNGSKSQ